MNEALFTPELPAKFTPEVSAFKIISKWLGKKVSDTYSLNLIALNGVPAANIEVLLHQGYSKRELDWIIPMRTLKRRIDGKQKLLTDETDRFIRALRIQALANSVLGSEDKAKAWLEKPRKVFGDKNAKELIKTEIGAQLVEDALNRIDSGYFA